MAFRRAPHRSLRPHRQATRRCSADSSTSRNIAIAESIDHSDEAEEVIDAPSRHSWSLRKPIGTGFKDIPSIVKAPFGSLDALYTSGQESPASPPITPISTRSPAASRRRDLIIIAARPSMGKTSFAMNIAENAAIKDGKVVGVFSLEMSKEALLMRMLCLVLQVDSHNMRTGLLYKRGHAKSSPTPWNN